MWQTSSSLAVLIFIGCSSSLAWPLQSTVPQTDDTKPQELPFSEGTKPQDPILMPHVKKTEAQDVSYFPGDEKWIEADRQKWNREYKDSSRQARKRQYVPLNSLTFMTANNEISPLDWHSANNSDIRHHIAGSKLAGVKTPSELTSTQTTTRPSISTEFHIKRTTRTPSSTAFYKIKTTNSPSSSTETTRRPSSTEFHDTNTTKNPLVSTEAYDTKKTRRPTSTTQFNDTWTTRKPSSSTEFYDTWTTRRSFSPTQSHKPWTTIKPFSPTQSHKTWTTRRPTSSTELYDSRTTKKPSSFTETYDTRTTRRPPPSTEFYDTETTRRPSSPTEVYDTWTTRRISPSTDFYSTMTTKPSISTDFYNTQTTRKPSPSKETSNSTKNTYTPSSSTLYTSAGSVTEDPSVYSLLTSLHKSHSTSSLDLTSEQTKDKNSGTSIIRDPDATRLPSKVITFIPSYLTTEPKNKTSNKLLTWRPAIQNSQTQNRKPPPLKHTTKRPSLIFMGDRGVLNSTLPSNTTVENTPQLTSKNYTKSSTKAQSDTVSVTNTTAIDLNEKVPGYYIPSKIKNQVSLRPTQVPDHFSSKVSFRPLYPHSTPVHSMSSSHVGNTPAAIKNEWSHPTRLDSFNVNSNFNISTTTVVPEIDKLVIHEAFNKFTKLSTQYIPTQSPFSDVTVKPITFIEEPSTVGLSNHAAFDDSISKPILAQLKDSKDRVIEYRPAYDWVTIPKPSARPHLVPVQASSQHDGQTDFTGNIKKTTTTTDHPNMEDTSVSEYEYDFYEDNLNPGGIQDHINPGSLNSGNSIEVQNPEHHPIVIVKVWEMAEGLLNLLKEHPIPMKMFQNTSLINGAVINPQDVPPEVLAMIADSPNGHHPLLDPALYHPSRARRSVNTNSENDSGLSAQEKSISSKTLTQDHGGDQEGRAMRSQVYPLKPFLRSNSWIENDNINKTLESEMNKNITNSRNHPTVHILQALIGQFAPQNVSEPPEYHNYYTDALPAQIMTTDSQSSTPSYLGRKMNRDDGQRVSMLRNKKAENLPQESTTPVFGGVGNDFMHLHQLSPFQRNVFHTQNGDSARQHTLPQNNYFGGIGNPSYTNLPLAIGTALEEDDKNYLQVLTQFANQLANSHSTDPRIQSYLKNLLQSSSNFQNPNSYNSGGAVMASDNELLSRSSENGPAVDIPISQPQADTNKHTGSVLELLPHDLPHVNPLLPLSGGSSKDTVDLAEILSSLPSSSTINREQLKNTLSTLTGTNTFTGHFGNQGYLNGHSHAAQNSVSGNYGQKPVYNHLATIFNSEPENLAYLTKRGPQPSQTEQSFYPFTHRGQPNLPNQQSLNQLPTSLPSMGESILQSSFLNPTKPLQTDVPHELSLLDHLRPQSSSVADQSNYQQTLGTSTQNEPATDSFPSLVQQPYGISNYPSPLLEFILNNASKPGFQPQQDAGFPLQQSITSGTQSSNFNPFDAYIPAAGGPLQNDPVDTGSSFIRPVPATFGSGTSVSSVQSCVNNTLCGLSLASLLSAGISKALLLPFLLGRRRRDLEFASRRDNRRGTLFPGSHFKSLSSFADNAQSYHSDHSDSFSFLNQTSSHTEETEPANYKLADLDEEMSKLLEIFYALPEDQKIILMNYTIQVLTQGNPIAPTHH